jgi:hypothetical protein
METSSPDGLLSGGRARCGEALSSQVWRGLGISPDLPVPAFGDDAANRGIGREYWGTAGAGSILALKVSGSAGWPLVSDGASARWRGGPSVSRARCLAGKEINLASPAMVVDPLSQNQS